MGELSRRSQSNRNSSTVQGKPVIHGATSISANTGDPRSIASQCSIRVLTHNIRYATENPFKGELPWSDRQPVFLSHLHYHITSPSPTIICLQEVLNSQLHSIAESLGPEWAHIGVGRDDGVSKGEYSPIFFQPRTWRQLRYETVWLNESQTPCRRGWDAASIRILTCLVLEQHGYETITTSASRILALNTHFDDQGVVARRESAKLVVKIASRLRKEWQVDFWFLAGDLNSMIDDGAYRTLNDQGSGFVDARVCLEGENDRVQRYGDETTFTGFDGNGDDEDGPRRLDFVHIGVEENQDRDSKSKVVNGRKHIERYAVLPNRFEDGIYMSDHRAVVVDLNI